MGGKKKAAAAQSRRARIAAADLVKKAANEGQEIVTRELQEQSQEEIEMMRAYGMAILDGEFKDDDIPDHLKVGVKTGTDIVPWNEDVFTFGEKPDEEQDNVSLLEKHVVLIEADHNLVIPQLNMEVWINGTIADEIPFVEMFARAGCHRASVLDEADLCVFVGGADVDPELYHHARWSNTGINPIQDSSDMEVYSYCLDAGIPMFGVCRGAQFLHVMNGGALFQDVDGHKGDHAIYDPVAKEFVARTSSVHHQLCMPNTDPDFKVLATANISTKRRFWSESQLDFVNSCGKKSDIEAFFYRNHCCLGVQGHPEYATYNQYTVWVLKQIETYIRHNADLDYGDTACLRIRKDLLAERLQGLEKKNEEKSGGEK